MNHFNKKQFLLCMSLGWVLSLAGCGDTSVTQGEDGPFDSSNNSIVEGESAASEQGEYRKISTTLMMIADPDYPAPEDDEEGGSTGDGEEGTGDSSDTDDTADNSGGDSNTGDGDGSSSGDGESDDLAGDPDAVDDTIDGNESCQIMYDNLVELTDDRQNYHVAGRNDTVMIKNADNAVVSGKSGEVVILGANHVVINGTHKDVCIVAKNISGINGNVQSGGDMVLLAEGEAGNGQSVDAINATADSRIMIMNFSVNSINGNFKELVLKNSSVQNFNGKVDVVHLIDGATIDSSNAQIGEIVIH